MALNEIKTKRVLKALGDRLPKKNASNESGGTLGEVVTTTTTSTAITVSEWGVVGGDTTARILSEGAKQHHTPEFVRHCVTAITEKPDSLDRVQQKKDGSPFAICNAQYNKNKRPLAAKHSQGGHHTVKQYEKALSTLRQRREEAREARDSRRTIVFEGVPLDPKKGDRRRICFKPGG